MLFSSTTFLFLFLPIVCLVYFFVRQELKNFVLLIASIIFYAWGEPRYLIVMLSSILINWIGAIGVDKFKTKSKFILVLSILTNLSFLYYFKYFNFTIDSINALFKSNIEFIKVVMPIGISFYTFQAMSYLIDVYRGDVPVQKDPYKLALYITLFPQLIAGPIVKYHDIAEQIDHRSVTFDKVVYGAKRFTIGLSKKILIANTMGAVADKIFEQPVAQYDCLTAWIGIVTYHFQIYFDFSGYSDMAIGLGSIFGFKFMENFDYPYISKSITEYWRRWHISLSTWFKEYLYIPLGGNRISKNRTLFNLWFVFFVTGIWHGAEWTFVLWGIWQGTIVLIERITGVVKKEGNLLFKIFQHSYTMFATFLGWILFRSSDLKYAKRLFKRMFGLYDHDFITYDLSYYVDTTEIVIFVIAIICSMPVFKSMLEGHNKVKCGIVNAWLIVLLLMSAASITSATYNPFIYFRF